MSGRKNRGRQGGQTAGRAPAPQMHTHQPHFAQVVSTASNGRNVLAASHLVDTDPAIPEYAQEDLTTSAAIESWDFSYDLGDTTLQPEVQAPENDGIRFTRRKVYENSVREWMNHP
jgi:hypothetical protein